MLLRQVSVAELKAAKKTVLVSKSMPAVSFNTKKIAKKYLYILEKSPQIRGTDDRICFSSE